MKKIVLLLAGICNLFCAGFIICGNIADLNVPKPVWVSIWAVYAVCNLIEAAYHFSNYRKSHSQGNQ